MKEAFDDKIVKWFCVIVAIIFGFLCVYPMYYCLIYALSSPEQIRIDGIPYIIPRGFTLENFQNLFKSNGLISAFLMSALRTFIGTVTSVVFTAVVAYPLSKKNLVFRKLYMILLVISMYVSGGLIPYYITLNKLQLIDNFGVFIIPSLFSVFNAILMLNYYRDIPDALEESAKMDGATDWKVFTKIIFPLSKPVMAVVALFNGVYHWNDFFAPAYFVPTNDSITTLPVILYDVVAKQSGIEALRKSMGAGIIPSMEILVSLKYTTMIASVLPIILIYPFLQKYFVKGIMVGSVKG